MDAKDEENTEEEVSATTLAPRIAGKSQLRLKNLVEDAARVNLKECMD